MGSRTLQVAGIVVAVAATSAVLVAIAVSGLRSESVTAPQSEPITRDIPSPHAATVAAAPAPEAPAASPPTAAAQTPATPEPLALIDSYDEGEIVEPDLGFLDELELASFSTLGWETDFSRHTVPFSEIRSGGPPRDGIPPIDNPKFLTPQGSEGFLGDEEPVVALVVNDDARAYPLKILNLHEIVNDEVGGVPVTVTFCPLCNSAIVFDRRLGGTVYDFGTSGHLRLSDLVMWDRQTETWWQQFTGEAIVGELAGKRLRFLPVSIVSFADFRTSHPEGMVLSRDTGVARNYSWNPYVGYERADTLPWFDVGTLDDRLLPKERVVTISVGDVAVAFPLRILSEEKAINYTVGGQEVVVLFKSGTRSALDQSSDGSWKDVGATGVFSPFVDGRRLTFRADGDTLVDNETGSVWNILGESVEGQLAGTQLTPMVHGDDFWFAWRAFKPKTLIYGGAG
ncbi:MAG: DUF3179 domain-containing protein [Chloroflexi bacterium]|nr:DUF3179 domain-containing protein [Chloroflexota bacterium]